MGDVIVLREWMEKKTNELTQKYRNCMCTKLAKELEDRLKVWGIQLARHNTFCANTLKEKERGD